MHELGLTQSILDIALDHARDNEAAKILKVTVKAGDLTGIIDDSIHLYFEYLTRETIAEGSELVIEHLPAIISCRACGEKSKVGAFEVFACPKCGGLHVELISGKEFYVDSIEID